MSSKQCRLWSDTGLGDKQCRSRSDTAFCSVWSGFFFVCTHLSVSLQHSYYSTWTDILSSVDADQTCFWCSSLILFFVVCHPIRADTTPKEPTNHQMGRVKWKSAQNVQIQIILCMCKVSSGPRSNHTFCSIQWFCTRVLQKVLSLGSD